MLLATVRQAAVGIKGRFEKRSYLMSFRKNCRGVQVSAFADPPPTTLR